MTLDSFARIIDLVVNSLPLKALGFLNIQLNQEGNQPYYPGDLLKLIIYGQRHSIRSANKLAYSALINTEIMWLLGNLKPSARTICYFRTKNEQAIKNAHKHFVKLLQKWDLIDGELIALDSTKVRAQNRLKNNFNQKKIDRHLEYLDGKIEEYLSQIEVLEDKPKKRLEVEDKLNEVKVRKEHYNEIQERINESKDGQVSTSDPEARAVIKHRNIVEVGYNIQATVDAKHNLVIDTFCGGVTDRGDLGLGAKRAQDLLGVEKIDLLADKGYHNGADIAYCERKGIRTFIPPSDQHHQKEEGFRKMDFDYDEHKDVYICPAGEVMDHELTYKKRNNRRNYRVKRYGTTKCEQCKLRDKCTTSPSGRKIERPNHQPNVERNNARVARYGYYYRLRQQIVEPVFGVLKRQWHFDHVIHKGRSKVEMEVSVAMLTYNLMRLVQIKGQEWVKKTLKDLILLHNWHYTQHSDWWMSMWNRLTMKKRSSYQAA